MESVMKYMDLAIGFLSMSRTHLAVYLYDLISGEKVGFTSNWERLSFSEKMNYFVQASEVPKENKTLAFYFSGISYLVSAFVFYILSGEPLFMLYGVLSYYLFGVLLAVISLLVEK